MKVIVDMIVPTEAVKKICFIELVGKIISNKYNAICEINNLK